MTIVQEFMKVSAKRIAIKFLKISGITLVSIVALMFFLPLLFPNFVATKIKTWANAVIITDLNFSKARLSFFNHFPALTLTLYDVSLKGSVPFQNDTLLKADEIALGVDLSTLFSSRMRIDEIFLTKGDVQIKVDKNGQPNYNVYRTDTSTAVSNDTSTTQLKIELIEIDHTNLVYDDKSIPIVIAAKELNYTGKGDLSKAIFDLASNIEIDSFDLEYDSMRYISAKQLQADLITKINTNSLAFVFEKNDLHINKLPVHFKGNFEFLENGYNMDFRIFSHNTNLRDAFTALPPEYLSWLENTTVSGNTNLDAYLTGKYIEDKNIMPDLGFTMTVRNGNIAHQDAPTPVSNLFLDFDTKLPSLNTDSLYINIDSLFFNMDEDYFSGVVQLKNLNDPHLHAVMNSNLDLEKWNRTMGISAVDLKGKANLHFYADGGYKTTVVYHGLRKQPDTLLSEIPRFRLSASLSQGYFKYASLPQSIHDITFNVNASCPDGNPDHSIFSIENVNATALNNFIKGYIKISGDEDLPLDVDLKTNLDLGDIKQFYPLDSLSLAVNGNLNIDLQCKGKFNPDKKLFPVTKTFVSLKNGSIQTKYYPRPVEKIQAEVVVTCTSPSPRDVHVALQPVSFQFEGQPFLLKADLKNLDDLRYNVTANGVLDIGKIYKVFAIKGYSVDGMVKTELALRGTQADATAGRYDKLFNSGTLKIQNIVLITDIYPQPFYISTGVFRFEQEKMWFDAFKAHYGKTDFGLKGYLTNVINYALKPGSPLIGNFDLSTPHFFADEFMVFADTSSTSGSNASATTNTAAATAGVIIVPSDLSLTLNATAGRVSYTGLDIKDFKGQVMIDSSRLKLNQTGFYIIDAPVIMDATYQSLSPTKAFFTYHINAQNFDVRKAYNEIKIFHDLAPSAANAQGVVSIDYNLSGKLNSEMYPVYPSLKGSGVLSVKSVQMKGFKLMNAVSSATDKADVKDPDLSKVDIKTSIENNIITLQRVKLRVSGFRPRFEGQMSFDGKLNLTGRLGLPPFGIIGIPFTVTGTQDNPQVHLRREKDSDKIEETTEEPDTDEQ
ncbi:MAG TPA: AsmA-like C-terminal region-containing protein [Parafilimonas sp.]|nr:AsmA-like C-terminal region-containing protein [Parafilimonas sp.]